ncbi:MAG: hypothetical protein KFF73_19805 [Cyclobacteriaceae bacterium]|nr:hypothetical protein [Cyclobacteriaceae bacterium]
MINYQLTKIRQKFTQNSLKDVRGEIRKELSRFAGIIPQGSQIAVAVGSRGIDNLDIAVKETIDFLKDKGAEPFIIPAMGSHGGATPEGQIAILRDYGITEEKMGIPVRSSMEVVEIPNEADPDPLYMDKHAFLSDGVLMINKIKPHTDFRGEYESGLAKMAVIGLGKEKGALAIHQYGVYGLSELLPVAAGKILSHGKILGGIALVENAYDETMMVRGLLAEEILLKEPGLLKIARENRPFFPAGNIDVLILDRMGKNISGAGIDTNIIGRIRIRGQQEPASPVIKSIMVTDLTDESHGNATGVGLADVVTGKLAGKIDYGVTYTNIVTSSFLERGKLPVVAYTDQDALAYSLRSCGFIQPGEERIIRAKDTLHLDQLYVSDSIFREIQQKENIDVIDWDVWLMDERGMLNEF